MDNNHHHDHEDQLTQVVRGIVKKEIDAMSDGAEAANMHARTLLQEATDNLYTAGRKLALNTHDIMCDPQPLHDGITAVFISRRIIMSQEACMMMVNATGEPGAMSFDITLMRPNFSDSLLSEIITSNESLIQELKRQLNLICTSEGKALFCMVLRPGYFNPEQVMQRTAVRQHIHQPATLPTSNIGGFEDQHPSVAAARNTGFASEVLSQTQYPLLPEQMSVEQIAQNL